MDEAVAALGRAAPDEIRDRVDVLVAHYGRHQNDPDRADSLEWEHNSYQESIADSGENECGLIGGYDVAVKDVNAFCVAYQRFADTNKFLPKQGREALAAVDRGPRRGAADARVGGHGRGRRLRVVGLRRHVSASYPG
jgi:hypothetical protein